MEPQLRKLGLHTTLIRGVPCLNTSHQLCSAGEKLSSEQCRILKLLGVQMAVSYKNRPRESADWQEFRINLGSRWSKEGGFVEGNDGTTSDDNDMDQD